MSDNVAPECNDDASIPVVVTPPLSVRDRAKARRRAIYDSIPKEERRRIYRAKHALASLEGASALEATRFAMREVWRACAHQYNLAHPGKRHTHVTRAEEVRNLVVLGQTDKEIAAEIGISTDYVRAVRSRHNIPGNPQPPMSNDPVARKRRAWFTALYHSIPCAERSAIARKAREIALGEGVPKRKAQSIGTSAIMKEALARRRKQRAVERQEQSR